MNPQEKMKVIVDYAPSHADNDIVKEGLIKCGTEILHLVNNTLKTLEIVR